jgi:hypothetical protein
VVPSGHTHLPSSHNSLQQSVLVQKELPAQVQDPPGGRHIGVVVDVEVVLVDVEVVGVVVLVDVLVEVVLVEVLVEVVLVVLVVVGAAVVVVVGLSHGPGWSPWRTWLSTALWETSMVSSSGVPGLWQMVTLFG